MTVYVPPTMIGRAALEVWRQVGKQETPLQDAERIVRSIRTPDESVVSATAAALVCSVETVACVWSRMIDEILKQVPDEERSLAFGNSRD